MIQGGTGPGAGAHSPAGEAAAALERIRASLADSPVVVIPALKGAADDDLRLTAEAIAARADAVAVLPREAAGAPLELALAARARVAPADARIALPGIAAGLPPAAGGAVRLARLIGAPAALDLLLTARTVGAADARALGLVDVVSEDPAAEALALAGRLAEGQGPERPARDMETAMRAVARASDGATTEVARRIAACVEGALLLPERAALEMERVARADLAGGRESRGLRYAGLVDRPAQPGGPEGISIHGPDAALALEAVAAGLRASVCVTDAATRLAVEEAVAESLETGLEAHGAAETSARASRISIVPSAGELAEPFVLLAVPETDPSWRDAALTLAQAIPGDAVLAAAVTWAEPDRLSQSVGREMIGWHRASRQLVEVVSREGPAADAALGLAGRLSLRAVRAAPGGPAPSLRLMDALRQAADAMVERGASPYEIDAAMRRAGFPLGPFEQADREGHDFWGMRRARLMAEGRPRPHSHLADTMIEAEWTGREAGLGYYDWRDGDPRERPDVLDLVEGVRLELGLPARGDGPADPARRCLLALVAEGARLVEEGVLAGPAEVDLVALQALSVPRGTGGPMFWAAEEKLHAIAEELFALGAEDPLFVPTAILLQSADVGGWLPA